MFRTGTRYAVGDLTTLRVHTFKQKEFVMFNIERPIHDTNGDPVPSFATEAEIEMADRLRHQIEERYLAPALPSPNLQARSNEWT
jgi:hypothetical protein